VGWDGVGARDAGRARRHNLGQNLNLCLLMVLFMEETLPARVLLGRLEQSGMARMAKRLG